MISCFRIKINENYNKHGVKLVNIHTKNPLMLRKTKEQHIMITMGASHYITK